MSTMSQGQDIEAVLATFANLSPADASATVEQLRGVLIALPESPASALRSQLEAFVAGYDAGVRSTRG